MMPLEMGKNEYDMILPSRGIRLIGIRFYSGGDTATNQNNAKHIQKSLYGSKNWYYFYKGFNVIEKATNSTEIECVEVNECVFDSSEFLYSEPSKVKISVSAIVGENGTGKSTILDTIIRVMNNLSAAIYGEDYIYTSAEHLHYIDNVYASLAVYVDTRVEIITCLGRKLTVTRYEVNNETLCEAYNKNNRLKPLIEKYYPTKCETLLDGSTKQESLLPAQDGKRSILRHLFYTLVSNYSLYAYNYRDYSYERTNKVRMTELAKKYPEEEYNEEDAYWLKGVFHKNDGYQTPVVIHPMREEGYINAAKVNYLGKQNLISLALEERERINEEGIKEKYFPFRVINQTHHIVAFYFYRDNYEPYNGFWEDCAQVRFNKKWAQKNKDVILRLERPIKEFWEEQLSITYNQRKKYDLLQQAWDYLAYKTIKIIYTYKHYAADWEIAKAEAFDEKMFKEHLINLMKDSSHRTAKLRRTVAFLRFHNDQDYYINKVIADLDISYEWINKQIGKQLYPKEESDFHKIEVEDLLPPPFVNVVLQLVDNEHLQSYKPEGGNKEIIPFEGLSSGERQIAYSIANIIYHLKNIESGNLDMNSGPQHVLSMKYNYVNILLDEVELYFHPDLQRRFVSLLVDSIQGLQLHGNFGINITMVTHSPFVLSDIPESNILYLTRDKSNQIKQKTFAANIHDLFNDAFFLPNTMGEIAQRKVEELVNYYHLSRYFREIRSGWRPIDTQPFSEKEKMMAKMQYIASIVGDQYLHDELSDMVDEMREWSKIDIQAKNEEN